MKICIVCLFTTTLMLSVPPVNSFAEPPLDMQGPSPHDPHDPRPAERWLEGVQKNNPEEHQRLTHLQKTSPDKFAAELRNRIQARALERMLDQTPGFRTFFDTLSPDQRETLLEALRQFPVDGNKRFHAARGFRQDPPAERPAESSEEGEGSIIPDNRSQRTRAEIEATYDRRTAMIEKEIDRIALQLENLRHLLDERKAKKERLIGEKNENSPEHRRRESRKDGI